MSLGGAGLVTDCLRSIKNNVKVAVEAVAERKKWIMRKILIIDNQKWILDLFFEALQCDGYSASVVPSAEKALEHIKAERFDLVLLSLYLKHGYHSWDVLQGIKALKPHLPVIILAAYDNYLYDTQLNLAQGYVINSWSAAKELRQKVVVILDNDAVSGPNTNTELVL